MASLASLALFLVAVIYPFGQLWRINLLGTSFPLIDLAIILLAFINLIRHLSLHHRPDNRWFIVFLLWAGLSLIINLTIHRLSIPKPVFYFFRLSALLSLFIFPPSISPKFTRLFSLCLLSIATFGLIQYFVWPNLTYLDASNWDPHLNRLVGTFLDPTFTGLILLLFLLSIYFYKIHNSRLKYGLMTFVYLALALTYSRSTMLCLVLASFIISQRRHHPTPFIPTLIIVILTLIILPKPYGEGTNLARNASITAKIINYREGLVLFTKSPIIGFGYNTLSQVRNVSPVSHAASGFDSSLLTILTTTGIIGFVLFLLGLNHEFVHSTFTRQVLFWVVLIHSLFANSLLFPWVLLYLALVR